MRPVGIGLLGPLVVDGDGVLRPRDRIVVSVLAVRRGQVVSAEVLADALWGEAPPPSWSKQVQICVARGRKALGPAAIETVGGGYRLALAGEDIDVCRFEQLAERGRDLAAVDEPDRAVTTFARALALWRGRPYDDLDGWEPGLGEVVRLDELRRATEEDFLDARLDAGEHRDVAGEAEARVAEEPLRERRWAILALAQYRSGRQADALRTLHRARRTLVDELGIDPGSGLVELEARILRQDTSLDAAAVPARVAAECPYKGLAAYGVDDEAGFFGRDDEVAACVERLASTSLLVVAGPSGCGKSSLVRAGLVPALARRGRPAVVVVPGADPEEALAGAAAADGRPVLVVDQFEELFTLDRPPEVVRAVCRWIVERAGAGATVVLVVRADHLAGLAVDPELSRLAERGLHLVTPLAGDALRAAIEEPARQAGLRLEHGLVDLLVRDTEGEPGALPLLSHALAETWRRRDGAVLTVEGYQATGSIRGAVARSADRLYVSLPPDQRTTLQSVLLRLVAPSLDGDPVRCRVASRTLLGDAAHRRVVSLLVRARLVTAAQETVELAHEALARAWPRLQSWLDDDAAGQRTLRHLAAAADGWDSLGRPDSELYRGSRLDTALEWRRTAAPDLAALEVDFLDASLRHATSEREALAVRAHEQARQNRRLRVLVAATGIFLVGALIAGAVAVAGRTEAGDQRDAARVEALVNRSLALRPTNRSVAALLAVEAYRRRPGAGAWSALLGTFTAAPSLVGYQHLPADDAIGGAAVVAGTSGAIVALDGADLVYVDLESGQVDRRFPPTEGAGGPSIVRVSDDGRTAVQYYAPDANQCGGNLDRLRLTDERGCGLFSVYDVASGHRIVGPVTSPFGLADIALNADGSLVAVAGGYDGDVAVYRSADATLVGTVPGLSRPEGVTLIQDTAALAFGPDGRLYVGTMNGPIRVVEPAAAQVTGQIDAPRSSSHNFVVPLADGTLVAGGDETLIAVDTATGATRWSADIRTAVDPFPCIALAVAPTAGRLYCGNSFGVIEARDLATGARTGPTLEPQAGNVGNLTVTPDGRELVAYGANAPIVSRWRLDGTGAVTRRIAAGEAIYGGYDPSGRMLLVARPDPLASGVVAFHDFAVWDPAADTAIDPIDQEMGSAAWIGPSLLGAIFADGTTGVYDVATRERQAPTDATPGAEYVALTPDGRRLYVVYGRDGGPIGGPTREIRTYMEGRRIDPTIRVAGDRVASLSALPDGSRVVVTTATGNSLVTTVHDGRTGAQIGGTLRGPDATNVSADGRLVGSNRDGDITEYDLDTLRPVGKFPGARGYVSSLQFSRDGSILLATSQDQTASIYDVATRTRIGDPFPTYSPQNPGGYLRPDGRELALTQDGGIAVWDIDPAHLATAACRLAGRNLTRAEWAAYLADLGDYRPTCPIP
jgi:DNA-binding SARP family transcriptional activator/WD40 repeat protein